MNVKAALVETRDLPVGRLVLHPPENRRDPEMYIVTTNDDQGAIAQQVDPHTHQRVPKHFLILKPGLKVALVLHLAPPPGRRASHAFHNTSGSSGTFNF